MLKIAIQIKLSICQVKFQSFSKILLEPEINFDLYQEIRSDGRGAGLNNGLVLLFESAEDIGMVRGLLSSHSADIWSHVVTGVCCINDYTRQAEIPNSLSPLATTSPPSSAMPGTSRQQRQVKVETQAKSSSPDLTPYKFETQNRFKVKCGHQRCGYV